MEYTTLKQVQPLLEKLAEQENKFLEPILLSYEYIEGVADTLASERIETGKSIESKIINQGQGQKGQKPR